MYKYFLIISFIMLALGPPGARAQPIDKDCFCTHHEDNPGEYGYCWIPEGAKLDTCGFGSLESEHFRMFTNCVDYLQRVSFQGHGDTNYTKREYYFDYGILFECTGPLPDDITYGSITPDQVPQKLAGFKEWLQQLSHKVGNFELVLGHAEHSSHWSFIGFKIYFYDFVQCFEYTDFARTNLVLTDSNVVTYSAFPLNSMDCLAGVSENLNGSFKILCKDNSITIKLQNGITENTPEIRLFDYTTGLISVPSQYISQSDHEIIINTDYLHSGLYLFFYHNNLLKFIKE